MAAMFVVPVWLATRENDQSQIMVVDESLMFINNLPASIFEKSRISLIKFNKFSRS